MVHACRFKDGKVAYSNRLVQTNRLKRERKLGFSVYQRVRACSMTSMSANHCRRMQFWANQMPCRTH